MKRAYKTTYRTTYKSAHLGSKLNLTYAQKVDLYFKNTEYYHWPLNETEGNLVLCRGSNPLVHNFMSNPGFEAYDKSPWTNGVLTTTEGEFRSGGAALKVISAGTIVTTSKRVFVKPGHTYNLKFWIRGDGTNAASFAVARADAGAFLVPSTSTNVTSVEFQEITTQFTAPPGFWEAAIWFRTAAVNGAYFCVDDITVTDTEAIDVTDLSGRLVSGYTLNQEGFNANEKSIYFHGTKSIPLSTLVANNFLPETGEGTLIIWGKPDLSTFTDGLSRWCVKFKTTSNSNFANYIDMFVSSDNNVIGIQFRDDNMGAEVGNMKAQSTSEWLCFAATWNQSGLKWFINGVQVGDTKTISGEWTKPFDGSMLTIGGESESQGSWKGFLAHCVLSGTALSDAAIQKLSEA